MTIQSETNSRAVARPWGKIITHAVNSKGLRYSNHRSEGLDVRMRHQ